MCSFAYIECGHHTHIRCVFGRCTVSKDILAKSTWPIAYSRLKQQIVRALRAVCDVRGCLSWRIREECDSAKIHTVPCRLNADSALRTTHIHRKTNKYLIYGRRPQVHLTLDIVFRGSAGCGLLPLISTHFDSSSLAEDVRFGGYTTHRNGPVIIDCSVSSLKHRINSTESTLPFGKLEVS